VTASVLAPPGGVALEPVEEGTPAFLAARCESVRARDDGRLRA